jgi:hypothetical protein
VQAAHSSPLLFLSLRERSRAFLQRFPPGRFQLVIL